MKDFEFGKFMDDIVKREKPVNEIKQAPETPQEFIHRHYRENYLHRMRTDKREKK
jgi:hypothetical protein